MTTARSVAAIAALAIACGRDAASANRSVAVPPVDTTTAGPSGPACGGYVTVRLRGVDEGALGTFDVDLASLDVTAKGAPLAPRWTTVGTLALVGADSYRLAIVNGTPGDATEVTLRLGRVHACDTTGCHDLDLCTAPISFRFETDKVSPDRCHVVLHLDLAKSVQPLAEGVAFLPRFSVHY